MLLVLIPIHGEPFVVDTTVQFDQFDITERWSNQTEVVSIWANNSQVFTDKQDQVTLKYEVVSTDHPVEVTIRFLSKSMHAYEGAEKFDSSTWLRFDLAIGNLLEGSSISITLDWKAVLNETGFHDINYDPQGIVIRQYEIQTFLSTTAIIWEQDTVIHYQATVGSRLIDTGDDHYSIDTSKASFTNTTSINKSKFPILAIPTTVLGLGVVALVIRRRTH